MKELQITQISQIKFSIFHSQFSIYKSFVFIKYVLVFFCLLIVIAIVIAIAIVNSHRRLKTYVFDINGNIRTFAPDLKMWTDLGSLQPQ